MDDLALPCISLLVTVSPLENQKCMIRDTQLEPHSSQCWWNGSCPLCPCSSVKQIHTSRIICSVSSTLLKIEVLCIYWSYTSASLRRAGNLTLNSQELVIIWSADSRKITPTLRPNQELPQLSCFQLETELHRTESLQNIFLSLISQKQSLERAEHNVKNTELSLIICIHIEVVSYHEYFFKDQVVAMALNTW